MLSLTCRDFQVEFWQFFVRNCVWNVKESGLTCECVADVHDKCGGFECKIYREIVWNVKESRFTCGSVHGKTCGSRAGFQCKIYRFQVGLLEMCHFTVISPTICFRWNATFHTVLCSCTWIVHVTLCAVGLQLHKMCRKCPDHPSSCLLTTAAERNKIYTGCYFFPCLVFSPHDVNVFVTDFTVDHVVTHVQGFSSGILTFFF